MSLVGEQALFLLDACTLIQWCTEQGWVVTGGELLRPVEMQEIYVKSGRSKTMDSKHIQKLAIDLNFFKDGAYVCDKPSLQKTGDYWESLNPKNSWGGNWNSFKDCPHYQRSV